MIPGRQLTWLGENLVKSPCVVATLILMMMVTAVVFLTEDTIGSSHLLPYCLFH